MSTPNSSAPNINVPIRIEPTDEYKIQEIAYDGQEKYIPPLSMSENLSRLIQKIDFNQPIDELRKELESNEAEDEESGSKKAQPPVPGASSWPFDTMRSKLRAALTEICVLNDVLAIANEKKYMIFDAVNPKPPDRREIVDVLAKKKALQSAYQVLLDGVSTIKSFSSKLNDSSSMSLDVSDKTTFNTSNYYDELREMRRNWRLRRQGNNIYGDLSYFRPMGFRFTSSSRFDVIKAAPGTGGPTNQALSVKIPPELEGQAYIQVSIIRDDDTSLVDLSACSNGRSYGAPRSGTWQEKLEAAQNVLFCKELFSHLANQTVQYQFVIPTTVTGNQIILALFPDIKLYITLVHQTPNTKCSRELSEGMKKLQREHKSVLEHSLHQMLKGFYANMFRKLQGRDIPKEAGPSAIDKQTYFELTRQESSLDKIVNQAQHLIMRQQTMDVIDSFAAKIKDPLIMSHWFCLNSPNTSIVRVDIVSHNNEILGRSHMLIHIGTKNLRVITRDCKNLLLGYEADELRHLLIWQSCLHQFIASDKLSKLLGWYTLILNYNVNVTRQEVSSTAFSLVICSANCTHLIAIKSGPQFGLTVEVAQFKESTTISNILGTRGLNITSDYGPGAGLPANESLAMTKDSSDTKLSRWQDLVDNFREVDWEVMEGKDFLTKLELLMAALTDSR